MVYAPWWNSAVTGGEDMVKSGQHGEGEKGSARNSILEWVEIPTASAKDGDEGDKNAEIGPVVKPVVFILGAQQRICTW